MKRRYLIGLIGGIILFVGGLVLKITQGDGFAAGVVSNTGMVMIVVSLVRHVRFGRGVEHDERTRHLTYKALAAAFQLSLFGIMGLWWYLYLQPQEWSAMAILAGIFISMSVLTVACQLYYARVSTQI